MDWYLGAAAIALLTAGLAGQGLCLRRAREGAPGGQGSPAMFADRRNLKWYAAIGAGLVLWYLAERGLP